jgi:excisionase family DNA binding protein
MEVNRLRGDMKKLGNTVAEFAERAGICRANVYELIRKGELEARKFGQRTIILEAEAQRFLESLPKLKLPPRDGK